CTNAKRSQANIRLARNFTRGEFAAKRRLDHSHVAKQAQRIDVTLEMSARDFVDVEKRDTGAIALEHRIEARPPNDPAHTKHRLRIAAQLELNGERFVLRQLGVRENRHTAERNVVRFGELR